MRLDQQNRRSCIVLLIVLVALIGLVVWMSLGGISSHSLGDDVQADVKAPPGTS